MYLLLIGLTTVAGVVVAAGLATVERPQPIPLRVRAQRRVLRRR